MITQSELKACISYNPESGNFTWLHSRGTIKAGAQAGCFSKDGYRKIRVNGKNYQAHRLAALYMNGEFPTNTLDHINRDRSDNRWCNLRECPLSVNLLNRIWKNGNKYRGVCWDKKSNSWRAAVQYQKVKHYLGLFKNEWEAAEAYNKKALELHGPLAIINIKQE